MVYHSVNDNCTVTRYTASFIKQFVAFILDAAGTASFIVKIMEEQTKGGGKYSEKSEKKRSKLSLSYI